MTQKSKSNSKINVSVVWHFSALELIHRLSLGPERDQTRDVKISCLAKHSFRHGEDPGLFNRNHCETWDQKLTHGVLAMYLNRSLTFCIIKPCIYMISMFRGMYQTPLSHVLIWGLTWYRTMTDIDIYRYKDIWQFITQRTRGIVNDLNYWLYINSITRSYQLEVTQKVNTKYVKAYELFGYIFNYL